jgi:hypothetical protein
MIIKKRKEPYLFPNSKERKINNKRAKLCGTKKVVSKKKAFSRAMKEVVKEIKKKKSIDLIDLDRILGKHGFSYTEEQLHNFMRAIKYSELVKFKLIKNPRAVGGVEYVIDKK